MEVWLITVLLTSLVAQTVKHLSTMWETQVRSLGQEDPLGKEMATHSNTIAWKIPWMEEPGSYNIPLLIHNLLGFILYSFISIVCQFFIEATLNFINLFYFPILYFLYICYNLYLLSSANWAQFVFLFLSSLKHNYFVSRHVLLWTSLLDCFAASHKFWCFVFPFLSPYFLFPL